MFGKSKKGNTNAQFNGNIIPQWLRHGWVGDGEG